MPSAVDAVTVDPLADDPRLGLALIVRAEGLPVSELLELLSKKSGVDLSVEADIGDEKLAAFNAARPLPTSFRSHRMKGPAACEIHSRCARQAVAAD